MIPIDLPSALDPQLVERLGRTLLHSLWQGAAVAALLALSLLALRQRSAAARHNAALAALLLLAALPVVTFLAMPRPGVAHPAPAVTTASFETRQQTAYSDAATFPRVAGPDAATALLPDASAPAPAQVMPAPPAAPAADAAPSNDLNPLLALLVGGWMLGVALLSIWHIGGWLQVQRLKHLAVRPLGPAWDRRLATLAQRLAVTRPVRLLESALVQVPTVAGWLRPVILVPAAALSGLSPQELDAILAHELAHVRRRDYVVAVFQAVIETLLFYHPAAWWVSAQVRREREDCCDDAAADACGGAITYARALASLEELRGAGAPPSPALAVTGSPLLRRVRRLLGIAAPTAPSHRTWSLAGAVLAALLACGPAAMSRLNDDAQGASPAVKPASAGASADDAGTSEDAGPAGQDLPAEAGKTGVDAPNAFSKTYAAPTGTVNDAQGNTVAGATVTLFHNPRRAPSQGRAVETVTTDAAGRFRLTAPLTFERLSNTDSTDHYVVFAAKEGFAVGWRVILSGGGGHDAYDVTLTPPKAQSFVVADASGKPLSGVRVGLTHAGSRGHRLPALREPFVLSDAPDLLAAVTGPDGRATLANVPDTLVSFRLTRVGFGAVQLINVSRPEPSARPVTLTPAGTITGTVRTADSKPVAGARVVAMGKSQANLFHAVADAEGRFSIADVVAKGDAAGDRGGDGGQYTISFHHDDFAADATAEVLVEPKQAVAGVKLVAVPGTLVTGRAVDMETGRPIAGAWVTLYPERQDGKHDDRDAHDYTDAEGRYRFRTHATHTAVLSMTQSPGGWAMQRTERRPEPYRIRLDGQPAVEADFHVPPLARLAGVRGRLLLPDGSPAAGAMVYPVPALRVESRTNFHVGYPTSAAADGSFELADLPVGHAADLYAETPDRRFALARRVDHPASRNGEAVSIGDLALRPAQTVDVLLTDAENKPLPDTPVRINPQFGREIVFTGHRYEVRSDAAGRLKIDGVLPNSQYLLRDGRAPDHDWTNHAHASTTLLKPDGGAASTQFVLDKRVPVRVLGPGQKPVPIRFINSLHVWIGPGQTWTLGRLDPLVKKRLADGWVLIDQQHLALAKPADMIDVEVEVEGPGRQKLKVSGVYEGGRGLELLTPEAVEDLRAGGNADGAKTASERQGTPGAAVDATSAPVKPASAGTSAADAAITNNPESPKEKLPAEAEKTGVPAPKPPAKSYPAPGGTVRDADGKPVAGAKIVLYYNNSFWGIDNRTAEVGETDATGAFRLTNPLTFRLLSNSDYTDHYVLFAIHPNHALAFARIFSDGPRPTYELTLTAPCRQSVLVTDPAGKPVAGARVALAQSGDSESRVPSLRDHFFVEGGPDELAKATGADGRVTFNTVPDVGSSFHVTAPKFGRAWAHFGRPDENDVEKVKLTPAATVSGAVKFADGAPVGNAVVFFSTKWMHDGAWTRTDAAGNYRIDHLIARGGSSSVPDGGNGAYDVWLRHDDCVAPSRRIQVDPGQVLEGFDLAATRGTLVKGKVLEPGTDRPVPGARVQGLMGELRLDSYADANGEFRWRAPAGELSYFFAQPPAGFGVTGQGGGSERVDLTGDGEVSITVHTTSALQRTISVRGRVLLPTGAPAAGATVCPLPTVTLHTGTSGSHRATTTNADGSFLLPQQAAGAPIRVYAETPDRKMVLAATATPAGPAGGDAPQDLGDLWLQPSVTAEVIIYDAAGKPRADTDLKLHPAFGDDYLSPIERQAKTDASGKLKLDGVVPDLKYLIRDGKWDTSDAEWLDSFRTFEALFPTKDPKTAPQIAVDNRLSLRVIGADQRPLALKRVLSITVWRNHDGPNAPAGGPRRQSWTLGPAPVISERLKDDWVLIDRKQIALANAGSVIEAECETDAGQKVKATGVYQGSDRIELLTDGAVDELRGKPAPPAGEAPRVDKPATRPAVALTNDDIGRIDPVMASKLAQRGAVKAEVEEAMRTLLPNHPTVVALKKRLAALGDEVDTYADDFRRKWVGNEKNGFLGAAVAELTAEQIGFLEPAMRELLARRDEAQDELKEDESRFTEVHPKIQTGRRRLAAAAARVEKYAAEYRAALLARGRADDAHYYISGVPRGGAYKLGANPVNLLQALIAAGFEVNANPAAQVDLMRRNADGKSETKQTLTVQNLVAQRDRDLFLQAGDVILVKPPPAAGGN